jgi:HemK family putative methylases
MNKDQLFDKIKNELSSKLSFLEDKPEETVESSLRALWLKATGISCSPEEASKFNLPDLSEDQYNLLHQLIEKRLNNVPLAHITGRQNFMGIELLTDSRALIPRKETEILGNTAMDVCKVKAKIKGRPVVFDICCGSGNLGLALSALIPEVTVFSSDLSHEAVSLASENVEFLNLTDRVTVRQGNLFEPFDNEIFWNNIDVIVCNPPYISSAKVGKMNEEISKHEPMLAFDGGLIGTKVINQLIKESPKFLVKGGSLIFEVGLGQGAFISDLCKKTGNYHIIDTVSDEVGNIRVIHCIL